MTTFTVIPLSQYQRDGANLDKFEEFCKTASLDTKQPAASNMYNENWEVKPNTLPYKIFVEQLYAPPKGTFTLLLDDQNNIIACSGAYRSEFCPDLLIAGARTWVIEGYRNRRLVRDYLLPADRKFAVDNGYKAVALSFDFYNKNLAKLWQQARLGGKRATRQSHHMFYNGLIEVEFPVVIQNSPQWVIYEKLTENWEFKWESIKT